MMGVAHLQSNTTEQNQGRFCHAAETNMKKKGHCYFHTLYHKYAGTLIFFSLQAPQLHENNTAQHKNCIIKLFLFLLQAVVMAKESIENAFNSTMFQWV